MLRIHMEFAPVVGGLVTVPVACRFAQQIQIVTLYGRYIATVEPPIAWANEWNETRWRVIGIEKTKPMI